VIAYRAPVSVESIDVAALQCFDCGNQEMNDWLTQKSLLNESKGGSRTYVVCDEQGQVAAFASLSAGAIRRNCLLGRDRYQTPQAIPINLLGRLAVDVRHQHQGLGSALVKFAVETTIQMSRFTGVYALVVQPLNESVIDFYKRLGFKFNQDENILYLPIRDKQGNFVTL
jgi:predicted N-acetyltransferase YhbS